MGLKLISLPSNERLIIVGVILLIVFIVRGSQFISTKNHTILQPGTRRDYGLAGGAVCPKCHRPIRLALFSIKLGFGTKIARCEFCGKWSIVHRLSLEELRAAEDDELAESQPAAPIKEKSESEKLREQIDHSKDVDRL